MRKLLLFQLLLCTLTHTVLCNQLLFVQELFRHGARGTISHYQVKQTPKQIKGELNPTGARQQYILGALIRDEYIIKRQFLSESYDPTEIYVRSTDISRAITSANYQLLGLYPENKMFSIPISDFNQDEELRLSDPPYSGIEVHVVPINKDLELRPWNTCTDYINQAKIFQKANIHITNAINSHFSELFQKLSNIFSQNVTSHTQVGGLFGHVNDVIKSSLFSGESLDPSLSPEDIKDIDFINSFSWFFSDFGTDLGTRELATPFLELLIKQFDEKIGGKLDDLKWVMYSAHDINLVFLMRALNITSYQCIMDKYFQTKTTSSPLLAPSKQKYLNCEDSPKFASSIIWELLKSTSGPEEQIFIKLKYDGKSMNLCKQQNTQCLYSEFKQRIQDYILRDYQEVCQKPGQNTKNDLKDIEESLIQLSLIYILSTILMFTLLLLCFVLYQWCKLRRSSKIVKQSCSLESKTALQKTNLKSQKQECS